VLRSGLALLLIGLAACQSDARRAQQARVANLAARIDRLRQADNAEKGPLLEQLKLAECIEADACGLKDLCVQAYVKHQGALDAIEEVKKLSLAPGENVASEPVRQRVSLAERDLAAARELGEKCADEQVRVVRKVLMP
jgi:hypothetical protein